jgi:hypothetical protein
LKIFIQGITIAFIGGFLLFLVTDLVFPTFVPIQFVPPTSTNTPIPNPPTATPELIATPTSVPPTATPSPTATPTSVPPSPTPNATLTLPDADIPSLNARVTTLRFYESGNEDVPFEQRVYEQSFSSETSRYINWELRLRNPAPGRHIDFSVLAIYYRMNASVWEEIGRATDDTYLEADWMRTNHTDGFGCDDPVGCWEVGSYRVDLYAEGKKIASGQFEIYTLSEPYTPAPTATPTYELDIPSFNADVTGLRFYESGNEGVPREEQRYSQRFSSETSRYINWVLDLEYPSPGRRIDFSIIAIYYRRNVNTSTWEEIWRQTNNTYVEGDWTESYHEWSYGCDDPVGCWENGYHRVDLYVEDKKIASEEFQIY